MKKSMVTKKEEALLLYMYDMAKNLHDFIKKNGYTRKDFEHCNVHVNIAGYEDMMESSFAEFYPSGSTKRCVSYTSFGNRKPRFEVMNYEDKKDDEIG